MNAEGLLAHFEQVADASNAIGRLRQFIFDLALRGKLVLQDPSDEPAHAFLKQIELARSSASKGAKGRKLEKLPPLEQDDMPYEVPRGWAWCRLGTLGIIGSSCRVHQKDWTASGVPFLRAREIVKLSKSGRVDNELFITEEHFRRLAAQGMTPAPNDLMITGVGTIGVSYVVRATDRFYFKDASVLIFKNCFGLYPHYIHTVMQSPYWIREIHRESMGTTVHTLTIVRANATLVPVPPLAEQHRIVAKVDELMTLCDRLETARLKREAIRERLTVASLARLNTPDPEMFQDDSRFAISALPALTARQDQIKELRQTIINLATCGKLVRQDPSDEPENLPASACEPLPSILPRTWRYTKLSSLLAEDTRNGYSRKPDEAADGTPILRISAGTIRRDGVVAEEEYKLISGIDADVRLLYGLKQGDLLACRFNGNKAFVGRLTIFTDYLRIQPIYPDKLIRVRIDSNFAESRFLRIAGDSVIVRKEVEALCATTVGNWGISASNLKQMRLPVPPLAEQRRIVAKVHELMALCDRLEASLSFGDDVRRRLLEALLKEALEPAPDSLPQQKFDHGPKCSISAV
ncbi:MAG: restriction endonuclease subunit S [Steroidobacteraceae bacterium]